MPAPANQLAAHTLRIKSPHIAQSATDALYRLRPELEARYGPAGWRHCATDIAHHLRFLAAAVELDDPRVFTDYASWAARVMVAHHVAPEDTVASFRALLDTAPPAVAPGSAAAVRGAIAAALNRIETLPPRRPTRRGRVGSP